MPRCNQRKREKSIAFFTAAKWGVCFAALLLFLVVFTACAHGDRYVEIVIASSDVVITPVPIVETTARDELQAANSLPADAPAEEEPQKQVKTAEASVIPSAVPSPSPTLTPLPTATPTPLPTITPTIKPSPTVTPKVSPTPTPKTAATPTPEPAPDTDQLLQQELDAAYQQYEAEWWKAYEKFSEKCLPVLDTMEYMGEPSDDPEYKAEIARLQALLDEYTEEFEAEIAAIEAISQAKKEGIYAKYGK